MFSLVVLSLAVGFCLNEEMALKRIWTNLQYPNESWFIVEEKAGIAVLLVAWSIMLLKGYAWGLLLNFLAGDKWFIGAAFYVLGNLLAVKREKKRSLSPWLALIGVLCSISKGQLQLPITVIAVVLLLTRQPRKAALGGKISLLGSLLINNPVWEGFFWAILLLILFNFSGTVTIYPESNKIS